jgi:hypothetical protein
MSKNRTKAIIELVKSLVIGCIAIWLAVWVVYRTGGNPYHEFLLMKNDVITDGTIIHAEEYDSESDTKGVVINYRVVYEFSAPNGKKYQSVEKCEGQLPGELYDLSKPYPITVKYLAKNPSINKIARMICDNMFEFIWRKIGIGIIALVFLSTVGFVVIKHGIQGYLSSMSKNVDSNNVIKP